MNAVHNTATLPPLFKPQTVVPATLAYFVGTHGPAISAVNVWNNLPPEVVTASAMGVRDVQKLTQFVNDFEYPDDSHISSSGGNTAVGVVQNLRRLIGGFNDKRDLRDVTEYTTYDSLGPLPLAVERAIVRNSLRRRGEGASILEIGAGQRWVAWGLKYLFGDKIITHEQSPKYSRAKGAIDVELPASGVEEADLPSNTFELSYAYFSSIYGKDQIGILQNVLDATRVGGEIFLMWFDNAHHRELSRLARAWPEVFRRGGLDVTIRHIADQDPHPFSNQSLHYVWVRKRKDDVEVAPLFDRAADLRNGKVAPDFLETVSMIRFSYDGVYFPAALFAPHHLEFIVGRMVEGFRADLGVDMQFLAYKMLGIKFSDGESGGGEAFKVLTRHIVKNVVDHRLKIGIPLSAIVAQWLQRLFIAPDGPETIPEILEAHNKALMDIHWQTMKR